MALSSQPSAAASSGPETLPAPERKPGGDLGLTRRALLTAVVLTVIAGRWVRQSEIEFLTTQITESVPAIPGLAALVLLLPLNAILRRIRGVRPFTRAELLVIFLFVTISSTVMGIGILQFLFALITTPFYYSENGVPSLRSHFPSWMMPHNLETIRHLYEHAPNGRVPWQVWWQPGLVWLGFFLAFWWTMYCLMALFYRLWAEEERLSFPLVFLPMEMTSGDRAATPFFRNKLMWFGFALSAIYNLVNILHAIYPSIPDFGKEVELGVGFTNPPWSGLAPLSFYFRPELIGLGYLVSTNISLAVWVSFLVLKLGAVLATSLGYQPHELYYPEQGIGAYLVMALMLVWMARHHLQRAWRAALSGQQRAGSEGISYRAAFIGLFGGFAFSWGFARAAGMAGWVALAYFGIVLAVALVYGRLRGQTGVPLVWLFPYGMPKDAMLYTFGSGPFAASGPGTLPIWATFVFLSRGYYLAMTGYQIEGMEIARRANIRARRVVFALTLALVLGFVIGWYNHLTPYYANGALHARVDGIWGSWVARDQYAMAAQFPDTPKPPEIARIWATIAGGIIVVILSFLHLQFVGFPLHPLGFAMACAFGSVLWGSFFIVWVLKSLALRYGGMGFYRKTIPFFLGFALGHFAIAGILWGLAGAWFGDAVKGYQVWFG